MAKTRSGSNGPSSVINIYDIDDNLAIVGKRPVNNDTNSMTVAVIDSDKTTKHNSSVVPWIIPRPTLLPRSDTETSTMIENLLKHGTVYPDNSIVALPSSSYARNDSYSSSTSKASSKSVNSNTLLLTAANLAKYTFDDGKSHHDYIRANGTSYDTESLASSTHFTLVNGMERNVSKPAKCYCVRHQLSILITTMTLFFAFTILFCIYFVQSKIRNQQHLS